MEGGQAEGAAPWPPRPALLRAVKRCVRGAGGGFRLPSIRTLRGLDPSTFLLSKGAANTWSQPGACVGTQGPGSLFSLTAALTAGYSPLTQTSPLRPGQVPLARDRGRGHPLNAY